MERITADMIADKEFTIEAEDTTRTRWIPSWT